MSSPAARPDTDDPLGAADWPVHTERLVIRRLRREDAETMWEYRSLPEVTRWTSRAIPNRELHLELMAAPESLANQLAVTLDGRMIGDLMVRVEDAWAQKEVLDAAKGVQAEIGWSLHPAFHGRGYATEAVRALLDICFGPLDLRRVHAECFSDNEPSWRLMERIGMRRESHAVRDALQTQHGWLDSYTYALLREEWPTA